jgi:hypothetical protein
MNSNNKLEALVMPKRKLEKDELISSCLNCGKQFEFPTHPKIKLPPRTCSSECLDKLNEACQLAER